MQQSTRWIGLTGGLQGRAPRGWWSWRRDVVLIVLALAVAPIPLITLPLGESWAGPALLLAYLGCLAWGAVSTALKARERWPVLELAEDEVRVLAPRSTAWLAVRWVDLADAAAVDGKLVLRVSGEQRAWSAEGEQVPLPAHVQCGDADGDAAVLRHFRAGDRSGIGERLAEVQGIVEREWGGGRWRAHS
ncbi:hypothetical protein [Actinokineospora bangkokensis]|uniref:hypothetical protein n=1 Tax=Actinokineospora bangkokensis TaxID=1193682 RepID=UPI001177895A|nr:hypothetical protein [Actinokineospora bangkokensis]